MLTKLSKSNYLLFLQHPFFLWLKKNDPSRLPPVNATQKAIMMSGLKFEKIAEDFFENGIHIKEEDSHNISELKEKVFFQIKFETEDLISIIDVLEKVDDNKYNLYEIKSSSSVKEIHYYDLAFQKYILEKNNINVKDVFCIHVNSDYIKKGAIKPKEIVKINNITDDVEKLRQKTESNIKNAMNIFNTKNEPKFKMTDRSRFSDKQYCLKFYRSLTSSPAYSIYDLSLKKDKLIDLENKSCFDAKNLEYTSDLSMKQGLQLKSIKTGERIIEKEKILTFLNEFIYPIYFLDYETFSEVVPIFENTSPYESIPFQYSLHILKSPTSKVEHMEYLHQSSDNPDKYLAEKLIKDIGSKGSVIAWYSSFEKRQNLYLAGKLPLLAEKINSINDRIIDLMVPFKKNWVVDKDFLGKTSIKNILPVLIDGFSYENMNIRNGVMAQQIWAPTFLENENNKKRVTKDLLDYCCMDTFAMYKIFLYLEKITKK